MPARAASCSSRPTLARGASTCSRPNDPNLYRLRSYELHARRHGHVQNAAARIRAFARAQRATVTECTVPIPGGEAGHTVEPVEAAGCYAPGGRYPLPSTVLMTAITARVAGCKVVRVASPKPLPIILAAAIEEVSPPFIHMGGGEVDLKVGCTLREFKAALKRPLGIAFRIIGHADDPGAVALRASMEREFVGQMGALEVDGERVPPPTGEAEDAGAPSHAEQAPPLPPQENGQHPYAQHPYAQHQYAQPQYAQQPPQYAQQPQQPPQYVQRPAPPAPDPPLTAEVLAQLRADVSEWVEADSTRDEDDAMMRRLREAGG